MVATARAVALPPEARSAAAASGRLSTAVARAVPLDAGPMASSSSLPSAKGAGKGAALTAKAAPKAKPFDLATIAMAAASGVSLPLPGAFGRGKAPGPAPGQLPAGFAPASEPHARPLSQQEWDSMSFMSLGPEQEGGTSPSSVMKDVRLEGSDAEPKWFVEDPSGEWNLLTRYDQKRLEHAWSNVEGRPATVLVQGGRSEAILSERLLKDRYGAVPPRPLRDIRRALWLRKDAAEGALWEPYREAEDAILEDAYQELVKSMRMMVQHCENPECIEDNVSAKKSLQLPSGEMVHMKLRVNWNKDAQQFRWELAVEERASKWWEHTTNILKARFTGVRRGLKPTEVLWAPGEAEEEAFAGRSIERVYVVVHGGLRGQERGRERAGSNTWERARLLMKWRQDHARGGEVHGLLAQIFRRHVRKCQLSRAGFRQHRRTGRGVHDPRGEGPWVNPNAPKPGSSPVRGAVRAPRLRRDETVEVSWTLPPDMSEPLELLAAVSLPDTPETQHIASTSLSMAWMFANRSLRKKVETSVAEGLEVALDMFRMSNDDFEGDTFLVGHGLEGVALFELLRQGKLSAVPKALFLLGCPLGALLQLVAVDEAETAGTEVGVSSLKLSGGTWVFNVFHPLDPCAYRLEPLLHPPHGELPCELIPLEDKRVAEKLCRMFDDAAQNSLGNVPNSGVRVDWALQGGFADDERIRPTVFTHATYLSSPKVAEFIYTVCLEIEMFGKKGSVENWLEDSDESPKALCEDPVSPSEPSPVSSPVKLFSDFQAKFSAMQTSASSRASASAERAEPASSSAPRTPGEKMTELKESFKWALGDVRKSFGDVQGAARKAIEEAKRGK